MPAPKQPAASLARPLVRATAGVVIVALLACGIATGLARLGAPAPTHAVSRLAWHGVLMIPVFFGAVIGVERAVALGARWAYLVPATAAAAGLSLLAGAPAMRAAALLTGAASIALAVSATVLRRQAALFLWVLAASVGCWWAGNAVWLLTGDPFAAVAWWLAFLILTIAAERLELTRVRPLPRGASACFCGIVALLPAAAALASWQPLPALRLFGAGELLLAAWLVRYDVARRTVRQRGLTRFIAVCLLSGYGWLAVSGALGLDGARVPVWGVVAPRRLPADIAVPGGYRLAIGPRGAFIEGADRAGLYYGVQTLFSLVPAGGATVPAMLIEDAPRFTHRGMHVDLARNFKPPATLRRLIDQMSAYKLNRLHLHLSDDEGWRIEIPGLPELTDVGARRCHDPSETRCLLPQLGSGPDDRSGGGYLTRDDYVALLRYAAERFVEVIPEIDMPAHSRAAVVSMEARYRRLHAAGREREANAYRLLDAQDTSNLLTVQFYDRRSDLNPCMPGALNFASKVIREIASMHADAQAPLRIWHFGGDEAKNILLGAGFQPLDGADPGKGRVDLAAQDKPWARSPACTALLRRGEIKSIDELPTRFAKQVSAIVNANGIGTMAAWQDGIKHASGPQEFSTRHVTVSLWDTIFWGASDSARDLSAKGYRTVLALPDYLYFDFPYTRNPRERGYYWGSQATDEYKVFSLAPENLPQNAEVFGDRDGNPFEVTSAGAAPSIEGIQGQAWGEVMRNGQLLEYMVYPRLLALAERAWHKADWELPYAAGVRYKLGDTHHVDTAALERDWAGFATVLKQRELPKLERAGIGYRKPTFTLTGE
ncbi:beta-N-acetylhexosaminidase [Burkholderia pseudomallei]|uniref:family 20 glycosylhydrolase n=1 Tax=Burkholderia pseudomallei TaxID=28450 RepID=UPI001E4E9CEE|nr:beta-N-acetylhexosaminidase [Burkholderia pseudomallei]